MYKAILKPIWTHSVQLWGTASNSNIDILQTFQSKVLGIIIDAPWYVPNTMIPCDLQVLPVRQEVRNYSITYHHQLKNHPNRLAKSLFPGLVLSENPSGHKQSLRLYSHRWYITGCIPCMSLPFPANIAAECPRTGCCILGDKKTSEAKFYPAH